MGMHRALYCMVPAASLSFMELPEAFLWGLLVDRPGLEPESFVGSLAENGCVHAVGADGLSRAGNVSAIVKETEWK